MLFTIELYRRMELIRTGKLLGTESKLRGLSWGRMKSFNFHIFALR